MKYLILQSGQIADMATGEEEALRAAEDLHRRHPNAEINVYTLTTTFYPRALKLHVLSSGAMFTEKTA
jgi:hypothetical protein